MNKDSISIVPYRNDKPGSSTHTLLVSNAGSCLWSIPLEECKTWIVRLLGVPSAPLNELTFTFLGICKTFLSAVAAWV